MRDSEYRAIDAVNISTLKELWSGSPRHYAHRLRTPRADTPAFLFGRLVHCAILEPHALHERYVVPPDLDRRTKSGKDAHAEWLATIGAREVVSEEQWDHAQAMAHAVRSDPVARPYLVAGDPEVPLTWTDQETGVLCKGRLDWIAPHALVGLKTARTAEPRQFAAAAARYGYHLQWAYYSDGWEAAGNPALPTVEIVVESAPPHDVVVYAIPDAVIDVGREEYRRAHVTLLECRAAASWPGIARGAEMVFELPRWARLDDDDTLDGLEV